MVEVGSAFRVVWVLWSSISRVDKPSSRASGPFADTRGTIVDDTSVGDYFGLQGNVR